jgi:hypothetical protein
MVVIAKLLRVLWPVIPLRSVHLDNTDLGKPCCVLQ